jgi:hypothetical protein
MRPGKFVGAAIGVPVYDATGEAPKFIGILDAGSKVAWQVPPGEHPPYLAAMLACASTKHRWKLAKPRACYEL